MVGVAQWVWLQGTSKWWAWYSHQLTGVNSSSNEVAARSEVLAGVAEHHVSSAIALKRIVHRELAADHVEPAAWVPIAVT